MEQLTQNLRGVAVYFDDILVSGDNAKDHLRGLRCNREKCVFAQVSIDYLENLFYSKFLPPYFSEITEPLYKLTRKRQQWKWGEEEAKRHLSKRSNGYYAQRL